MAFFRPLLACFRPQESRGRRTVSVPVKGSLVTTARVVTATALPTIQNPPRIPRKQHRYQVLSDGRVVTSRFGNLYVVTKEGLKPFVLPPKRSQMQELDTMMQDFN